MASLTIMRKQPQRTRGLKPVFEALINAFRAPDIRRRILFVLGMLVVYRALAVVPVPAVDRTAVANLIDQQQFLQLLDLFSGGGLRSFSIVAMGVNPYINASIIMQLMTGVVPRLQALSREGEYGRTKINQYTRYLTVPLALLQAYGYLAILSSQGIVTDFDILSLATLTQMVTLAAGTVLAMWIGELITERGIGNGISFIIFAGIVARVPQGLAAYLSNPDIAGGIAFVILAVVVVGGDRLHPGGPAAHPHPVRQPRPRPAHVPGRRDVPAAARQPGRRHPDHLRGQHPALPDPDRVVLRDARQRARGNGDARQPDRRRGRQLPESAGDAVHRRLLPADDGLHVLLHGVHVQAR